MAAAARGGSVRYGILGSLVVTGPSGEVPITAGRDRIVLALRLVRAGRIVGVDELVDAVWARDAPTTARGQLQTCVSRLRRILPAGTIRTNPSGYAVDAAPGELDLATFTALAARARETQSAKLYR